MYLELLGGAEPTMELDTKPEAKRETAGLGTELKRVYREPRVFDMSSEQLEMHRVFLEKNIKSPIWLADEKKEEGQA